MSLQSLIRTAEQLKIKGLCEINDQTAAESDTEVIYPPHKKIRASRHYESHHNQNRSSSSSSNKNNREESIKQGSSSSSASHSVIEKDAQPIASQDTDKRKSKSPIKDIGKNSSSSSSSSPSPSNQNQSKNMASLEMGMVSINLKFHKCLIASFVDVVVVVFLFLFIYFFFFHSFAHLATQMCSFLHHPIQSNPTTTKQHKKNEYDENHTERKCGDGSSSNIYGFRTRATRTNCNACHYNRSKLHAKP